MANDCNPSCDNQEFNLRRGAGSCQGKNSNWGGGQGGCQGPLKVSEACS